MTGVGGTQLHLDAKGNHTSPDTAWNDTGSTATNQFVYGDNGPHPLASGGGTSALFDRPFYQDDVSAAVGGRRGVPDISMSAACDGAVDVYMSVPGSSPGGTDVRHQRGNPAVRGHRRAGGRGRAYQFRSVLIIPARLPDYTDSTCPASWASPRATTRSFLQGGKLHTVHGSSAQGRYSTVTGVGTVNGALLVPELARFARS